MTAGQFSTHALQRKEELNLIMKYEAVIILCSAGELLTVAPWAARKMPGLFTLNERAVLSGSWEHGFFSFTAVGAYNVGSIRLEVDKVHTYV